MSARGTAQSTADWEQDLMECYLQDSCGLAWQGARATQALRTTSMQERRQPWGRGDGGVGGVSLPQCGENKAMFQAALPSPSLQMLPEIMW